MKIGIDIDGCLIDDDEYLLDCYTKYCYENNLPGLVRPYAFENKCDWDEKTMLDYRDKYFFDYIDNVEPRRFASEVTHKLHEDGNTIVIITGRYMTKEDTPLGKQMRENTEKWLKKNNIYYDKIIFSLPPKIRDILKEGIDVMIDDSPEIVPIVSNEVKVLCFDNRYNRKLNFPNMTKVFSWYDVYMKIKEIK